MKNNLQHLKINLPFRSETGVFLFLSTGIPFFVYLTAAWQNENLNESLRGLLIFSPPFLFTLMCFLPFFQFRSGEEKNRAKPLIKIPLLEFYAVIFLVIVSVLFLNSMTEAIHEHQIHDPLVMSVCGVFILADLIALNHSRIWFKDQSLNSIIKKELEIKFHEQGCFHLNEEGFDFKDMNDEFFWEWKSIDSISASKTDNFAYDTVQLIIKKDSGEELIIHEDVPGWYYFKDHLHEFLHDLESDWEIRLEQSFSGNEILFIYRKPLALSA